MKKMTKIALVLISLVCAVCAFAGTDTLTACGVPQIVCDLFGASSGVLTAGTMLFPVTEQQTGIVIAYQNKKMIADEVMPIDKLEGKELSFKYFKRTLGDAFTVPDTKVGRASEPNLIHLSGEEVADFVVAHGLEDLIPKEDLERVVDMSRYSNTRLEYMMNLLLLGREKEVADIVQNTSNYGTGCSHTYENAEGMGATGFDIVATIMEYLEKPFARPNILGMGAAAYHKLRMDPNVLKAIYPTSNGSGVATRQQLCELFEVDKIIVGESRVNTTKNSKTPTLERCWGSNIWGHYQEQLSSLKEGIAWGITAQVGDRIVEVIDKPEKGLKGSELVKVGFYQKPVVTAKDAGFLLKNVVKTA